MLCMIGSLDFLVLKGPTCSNLYPAIHPYQSEELVGELEQVLISLLPLFFIFFLFLNTSLAVKAAAVAL